MKRKILQHTTLVRTLVVVFFVVVIGIVGFFGFKTVRESPLGGDVHLAKEFISPTPELLGGTDGKVNILLMGKGGAGHDAPDLTDTMIFASLDLSNKKITLISIPRDIWLEDLKAKVNTAYYYGNKKEKGGGVVLAKSSVEEIVGKQIDFAVVVDFNAFKEVIDTLGGVEVNVQRGFTDNQYPIAGRENDNCGGDKTYACRYETVTFNEGLQTMDGDTALKFVRSRHASGDEGTDIAREVRQELIIKAIVKKALTPRTLLSYSRIKSLIDIAGRNVETDVNRDQAATLSRYIFNARNNIKSYTIPAELLINPPVIQKYLNQYVFIPKDGNWNEVQKWVDGVLKN